ncbi:MFS transporter [Propionibacterium australiense]|nr:MFS transporter [Propionibacterium australiense]
MALGCPLVSRLDHRYTIGASYVAYVVQAIVNNLGPLLFVIWHDSFGVSLARLGSIVGLNFGMQLVIDFCSARIIDLIGYRAAMVIAHVAATIGVAGMGWFPFVMSDPYAGLLVAMAIAAVGGGLLEVLISPVVEACPTENKAFHMSLLHSFYSWGQLAVVLLTTAGFAVFGIASWRIVCFCWAVVPLANAVLLWFVPYYELVTDGVSMSYRQLFSRPLFWGFIVLMLAAGASEQSMSQWASTFAQTGLGLSKTVGDLLGPMLFALCMGSSRVIFGARATTATLSRTVRVCAVLCIVAYLLAILAPLPWLGLAGMALCGFSVGIFWPGTFSLASEAFPRGGTALFALLALGGDAGCALGPDLVGHVADHFGSLSTGLLVGLAFPVIILTVTTAVRAGDRRSPATARA